MKKAKDYFKRFLLFVMPKKIKDCSKCCLFCEFFDDYCKNEFFTKE